MTQSRPRASAAGFLISRWRGGEWPASALALAYLLLAPVAVFASNATVVVLGLAALLAMPRLTTAGTWLAGLPWPLTAGLAGLHAWALVSAAWAPGEAVVPALRLVALSFGGVLLLAAVAGLDHNGRRRVATAVLVSGSAVLALLVVEILAGGRISQAIRGFAAPDLDALDRASAILAPWVWPLALGVARRRGWRAAALFFITAAATLAVLPMFAAFLGLLIGGLVFLVVRWRPRRALVVLLAAFAVYAATAPLLSRQVVTLDAVRDSAVVPVSWKHRVGIWEFTANLVADHPVRGRGLEAARVIGADAPKLPDFKWTAMPLHPHNAVLHVWLELGAVGVILALLALAGTVAGLHHRTADDPVGRAVAGASLATFLTIALLSYGAWQNWWLATAWLVAGANALFLTPPPRSASGPHPG